MNNRLARPVNIMRLEDPEKFWIDCPIDVWPSTQLRRIEIPRELARYLSNLQAEVSSLNNIIKEMRGARNE